MARTNDRLFEEVLTAVIGLVTDQLMQLNDDNDESSSQQSDALAQTLQVRLIVLSNTF